MLPEAEVYLLDEPMIGLDKAAISRISERIRQMIKEGKTTLITMSEAIRNNSYEYR
jgi:ABC-type multidrug transport system ATPase subunit